MSENPSVSVVVITYNSSKYVIETLDSIYNQKYRNIELIISDDCSTDETTLICEEWLRLKKNRFVNTKLIRAKENSGIAANCNRGVKAARGEWIKLIAGDDLLFEDGIKRLIKNVKDELVVYSNMYSFVSGENSNQVKETKYTYHTNPIYENNQYKFMLRCMGPHITTMMFKNEVLKELGYFDERIPMLEDWPLLLKISKRGIHFSFIDVKLLKYRVGHNSISSNSEPTYFSNWEFENKTKVYELYIKRNISIIERVILNSYYWFMKFVIFNNLNKIVYRKFIKIGLLPHTLYNKNKFSFIKFLYAIKCL